MGKYIPCRVCVSTYSMYCLYYTKTDLWMYCKEAFLASSWFFEMNLSRLQYEQGKIQEYILLAKGDSSLIRSDGCELTQLRTELLVHESRYIYKYNICCSKVHFICIYICVLQYYIKCRSVQDLSPSCHIYVDFQKYVQYVSQM